jgi:deoxyribonuclease V
MADSTSPTVRPGLVEELIARQREIAARVIEQPLEQEPRLIGAVDMHLRGDTGVAAAVVMDFPALSVVEEATAEAPIDLPYIPGLLSFREAPACLRALAQLQHKPDLLLIDGHGRAHPRRCGVGCHIGVKLGIPTIGVAKSRLTGRFEEPGDEKGATSELRHRNELVGRVVRTRDGVRPVFVSVGNLITLDEAVEWTLRTATRYRLPEPSHRAHRLASQASSTG